MPDDDDISEAPAKPKHRRRASDNLPQRQQPVSLQQAVAASIVTAMLGGGLGVGGISLGGGNHDHEEQYVAMRDMHRIEAKVDKVDSKVESLDSKLVDLRIALAQRGIAAPTP